VTPPNWKFPLIVVALSSRKAGFAAATGPMKIDAAQSWSVRHVAPDERLQLLERRILRVVEKFDPETILVTHGSRWRLDARVRTSFRVAAHKLGLRIAFFDLEEACRILGCERRLRAAAERVVDSHPDLERRLRPVLASPTSPAVRDRRPLLSALAVAHAASVAHLIKFG